MEEIIHAFGLDWRLLLVQMFNFGLLLLVLWYVLYRPLVKLMHDRQQKIEKGVKDAELAEVKLQEVEDARKVRLQEAEEEAEALVSNAREHAKGASDDILKTAHERSEAILKDADERGKEAEAKRLKAVEEEIAKAAVLGAKKILENHDAR